MTFGHVVIYIVLVEVHPNFSDWFITFISTPKFCGGGGDELELNTNGIINME